MVVVLVDEQDVDVTLLQLMSRSDTREAAPQDEYPGSCAVRVGAIAHVPRVGLGSSDRSPQGDEVATLAQPSAMVHPNRTMRAARPGRTLAEE